MVVIMLAVQVELLQPVWQSIKLAEDPDGPECKF